MALGAADSVVAQGSRLTGSVYHVTPQDSVALSGRAVLLHRVQGASGTVVDSAQTGRSGMYRFFVTSPDTSVQYFVSVAHNDIGYLSPTMALTPGSIDTVPSITVYDTAYATPLIVLRERHMIVREMDVDGTRQIIELLTLGNGGRFTRISADTANPSWQSLLPAGASQLVVGESQVGRGAVYLRDGRIAVAAPIPPGEKQLLISYMIPEIDGELQIPVDQPIRRFTVSLADTSAEALGGGLVLYGVENVGGAVFKRYDAGNVTAGTVLSVHFQRTFFTVARLEVMIVVAVVIVLVGTLTWWLRNQTLTRTP
jgi:hypothetical protein